MIEHKLLYYPKKAQFEQEKDNIADTSIAFIEDSGTIYTHKHEFGGNGGGTNTEYTYEISKQYTDDQINITVGRIMDAVEGIIKDFATKNYVTDALTAYGNGLNVRDRVEQILNAKDPSWEVIVQRLGALEGSNHDLIEQIANIRADIRPDGEGGSYPTITLETIYRLFNEGDGSVLKNIVAKIFMMANEEGSQITLDADKIYLGNETNQLKLYIRGAIQDALHVNDSSNALTYAQLLATGIKFETADGDKLYLTQNDGLKYTAGRTNPDHAGEVGYQLANDGSGSLAFGNITWDSSGNLTTHGLMLKEAEEMGAPNSFIVDSVVLCPAANRAGVSDFQSISYFEIITYHICKAGFIIKQGEAILSNNYFMQADENPQRYVSVWTNGTYGVAADSTLYTVGYRAYRLPAISAQRVLAEISRNITSDTWQNLIKNSNGEYIFENEENVYVGFPGQISIVSSNSGSIFVGTVDGSDGSDIFEAAADDLQDEVYNALTTDGYWESPTYTYRGEYDDSETYHKNDIVSVIYQPEYPGSYYDFVNFLCLRDQTEPSSPNRDAEQTDDTDWANCSTNADLYRFNVGQSPLSVNSAGWTISNAAPQTTDFSYTDTSNNLQYVQIYNIGSTYKYSISPSLVTNFRTEPKLFYGTHIVQWNNGLFDW